VIPQPLRDRAQWVVWRWVERDGKRTKVPHSPLTGQQASSTDPATWGSYADACAFRERHGWVAGVGFVVTPQDDVVGIDLDHCRDAETGAIAPWAQALVDQLDSYSEVTPSGTGLRVFVFGTLPPGGRKRGDVEMYEQGRYLTVTSEHLPGTPATMAPRTAALARIHAEVFGQAEATATAPTMPTAPSDLADAELITRARVAANGASFARLWAGDWSRYSSQSEADAALCNYLAFWTRGDRPRVDSLFRQSGLFRSKWDERHHGDGRTYGEGTMDLALSGDRDYYGGGAGGLRFVFPVNGPHTNGSVAPKVEPACALTDLGNAQRLVHRHGADLRYCHLWSKWLIWDGHRWRIDETGEIVRLAKKTVQALYLEAAQAETQEQAQALAKHAVKSQGEPRIRAMITLAESEPSIPARTDDLDAQAWLLCVQNGVIDLRTGWLRSHDRGDLITRLAPVAYDPDAECPIWLAFLERIMDGDSDLIGFLQRAVGYALTGDVSERALFLLYGTGANGKSTFLETLRAVLGEYAMRTPTETLLARHEGAIPNDVARLKGARFVAASEAEEGKRLAEALVKALTGGDTISARYMRGEWFDFKPEFKLWLATNHKPIIRGTDRGIWDRIRLIPFLVRIPDDEQDKALTAKLWGELPGILAWAVRGCLAWQQYGLDAPTAVTEATSEYRAEMDILGHFCETCCVLSSSARVSAADLYAAYKAWAESAGERAMSQRAFGARMLERNFESRRAGANGSAVWCGLGLVASQAE
jgi:putative DNA primase/helicase